MSYQKEFPFVAIAYDGKIGNLGVEKYISFPQFTKLNTVGSSKLLYDSNDLVSDH